MSTENRVVSLTLVAAADLSAKQYHAATVNSSGQAAVADADDVAVGVIQNKPASGQAAVVAYAGASKALYGGTVAAGARVTANASGHIVAASAGDSVLGVALVGGVSGDIGTVLIGAPGSIAAATIS